MSNQNLATEIMKNKKIGFTLVEIMVAISIFAIVALVATDAFITADRVSKKAQAMKTVIDNLHFALNAISFNLQQGGTYHCILDSELSSLPANESGLSAYGNYGRDCAASEAGAADNEGGPAIVFRSPKSGESKTIIYKFQDNGIWYWESGLDDFIRITIDNLKIERLRFYVHNAEVAKATPRVFFTIAGVAELGQGFRTPFQLQTVVSERI
jgi:prepilin-type N-terminal cleavage/methylation domain-containing protein